MTKIFAIPLLLLLAFASCAPRIGKMSDRQRSELLATEQGRVLYLSDPVQKTKSYVVISEVLLSFATKSFEGDEMEDFEALLCRYLNAIKSARETILASGIDARRDTSGYKHLEVALREHSERLQAMSTQSHVWDPKPFEEALGVVTTIRNEMLQQLGQTQRR